MNPKEDYKNLNHCLKKLSKKNVCFNSFLDFKTNNTAWMTYIDWKTKCKTDSEFTKKVKEEGEVLLKKFLRALFDM